MGRSKLNTCAWCHKPTNLPEVFAAETPILEWFEKKIEAFCDKNNVVLLRTIGVIFSDEEKRTTQYVK